MDPFSPEFTLKVAIELISAKYVEAYQASHKALWIDEDLNQWRWHSGIANGYAGALGALGVTTLPVVVTGTEVTA